MSEEEKPLGEWLSEVEGLCRLAPEKPREWEGRKQDEEGFVWVPQGSYFGETLICLGDDYEDSGNDCDYVAGACLHLPRAVAELRQALETMAVWKRAQEVWQDRAEKAEAERDALLVKVEDNRQHAADWEDVATGKASGNQKALQQIKALRAENDSLRARVEELEGYLEDQQAMPDDSWRKEKASPS